MARKTASWDIVKTVLFLENCYIKLSLLHLLQVKILHLAFLEKTATFAKTLITASCNDILSIA